jgi:hypothetical protein
MILSLHFIFRREIYMYAAIRSHKIFGDRNQSQERTADT